MKESWTGEARGQETVVVQAVEMQGKLQEMMGLVQVNFKKAQERRNSCMINEHGPKA